MKMALKAASFLALGLTVVPAFMVAFGVISWGLHASLMLAGTLVWFASAPFWMRDRS